MTIPIITKKEQLSEFRADMLNKSLTMFERKNLPDTLPAVEIEKQLQTNGYTIIGKVQGNVYAFQGGFSGQDPYNQPTTAIVNNPSLKYNGTFTINENCVIIKNDDMQQGLMHIYNKYGTLLIENQITMLMTDYNYRMPFTISSKDDSTTQSAREYLQKIIDGSLGVIGEAKLFDALKVTPTNNKGVNSFADLYGYQQFIEAQLNNTIGLATNNNMKRERLTTNEIEVNKNASFPLIDNMLRNRKQAVEKINKMFDLDIEVEFSSIWNSTNEDDNNGINGDSAISNNDTSFNGGVDKSKETNQKSTNDNEPTNETQPEIEQDNQTDEKPKNEVENEEDNEVENKEEDNEPTNSNADVDKKSTDELSNDDQSNDDDDTKDRKDDDKK